MYVILKIWQSDRLLIVNMMRPRCYFGLLYLKTEEIPLLLFSCHLLPLMRSIEIWMLLGLNSGPLGQQADALSILPWPLGLCISAYCVLDKLLYPKIIPENLTIITLSPTALKLLTFTR